MHLDGRTSNLEPMTMTRNTKPSKPRDVVTLADLSPRHRVIGGRARRVFGSEGPAAPTQEPRGTRKATKDLAPKSSKPVKGGRLAGNDNLTLLRAAKPAVKDLPAGKDIKGGKKTR
jgi:hypothetical protein